VALQAVVNTAVVGLHPAMLLVQLLVQVSDTLANQDLETTVVTALTTTVVVHSSPPGQVVHSGLTTDMDVDVGRHWMTSIQYQH